MYGYDIHETFLKFITPGLEDQDTEQIWPPSENMLKFIIYFFTFTVMEDK